MRIVPSGKALAVVNMLVGTLMVYGGVLEAVYYWALQANHVIAGLAGAVVGAVFIASGVAVWKRWGFSRALTAISCVLVVVVHAASWRMGFLGVPAIVLTIIYPMLVLLSLRRARLDALPASQEPTLPADKGRRGGALKRIAVNPTL
jgi:hypothetical protein